MTKSINTTLSYIAAVSVVMKGWILWITEVFKDILAALRRPFFQRSTHSCNEHSASVKISVTSFSVKIM